MNSQMKARIALAGYWLSLGFLVACAGVIVMKLIFWPICTSTAQSACAIGDSWTIAGVTASVLGVAATVLAILGAMAVAVWWTGLEERVSKQISTLYAEQKDEQVSKNDVNLEKYLSFRDNLWVFEVWDCIPGPAESDFHCTYTTYEGAIKAVTMFLYGEPTIIDGWIVPLHRHPELTIEGVKDAITNSIHISQGTFDGIVERRKKRIEHYYWVHGWRKHVWERAYQSQFLSIAHQSNPSLILCLRRDMQECYIVHV